MMSTFEKRQALVAEQAALQAELRELATNHGARRAAHQAALNEVRGFMARYGSDSPALAEKSEAAEAARLAMIEGDDRQDFVTIRLAEIHDELSKPLTISAGDIKKHLGALGSAAERIAKLETALASQRETVARLAETEDPRPELAEKRASLQADVAIGDKTQGDLDRFDSETGNLFAAADAAAHALVEAQSIAEALEAKLAQAESESGSLAAMSIECRVSILARELADASTAHTKAAAVELQARERANGLAYLLQRANRTAATVSPADGRDDHASAQVEAQRLADAGYSALF